MKNSFRFKLFIDLETTGLNPKDVLSIENNKPKSLKILPAAGIIEIYAELYDQDNLIGIFHEYAEPTEEQYATSTIKNNIDNLLKNKNKITQHQLELKFISFLNNYIDPYDQYNKVAFIAYNSSFDESFIREVLKRSNLNWGNFFITKSICLYQQILFYLGDMSIMLKETTLASVSRFFRYPIEKEMLHGAKYDVQLLKHIWKTITNT